MSSNVINYLLCILLSNQELSATSEHDPDKLSKVTPSKRCSMKDQDDDIPIGQLSSNKNTKMKLRNVKMEKAPV
jgi:hypothetical protein